MRWIWIDRFVEFKSGQFARAVKNLSLAEDYFADHFPGYPVMPAALMLEGLAQTGGILVGEANDYREKVILAKILHARFHGEVLAGRQLIYETDLVFLRPEGASVQGRIFAAPPPGAAPDGANEPTKSNEMERVADAEIFFAHLDQARSQQIFGDHNFVFTGELKHLLGLVKATTDHKDGS